MSGFKNLTVPGDLQYLYDGSLEGFFCCVYESVYSGVLPQDILPEWEAEPCLLRQQRIPTDPGRAERVRRSIPARISNEAMQLVGHAFFSQLAGREIRLLRFLLLGYERGRGVTGLIGHPDVAALLEAERHLLREVQLLLGFVRFTERGGVLTATISPKNFVLPFMAKHFAGRYPQEAFVIFDEVHGAALFHQKRQLRILPVEELAFPAPTPEEAAWQALWKRFYQAVSIEHRYNPKCRMGHMPKRYWQNMFELQDLLQGGSDRPAGLAERRAVPALEGARPGLGPAVQGAQGHIEAEPAAPGQAPEDR
ncbi:MAG: DNA metabolism protein [Clostridiales bacterium]|nr:DNA metabolism protein [Clostridiales bacterium]